jgi:peptidoglycan/xylan/chitin deacetylase (PgdA/CDA1 family)
MIPPILCYHKIDTRLELGFTRLGPRAFQKQIESLAKLGYRTMGSTELYAQAETASRSVVTTLPSRYPRPGTRYVVLSFDDGYEALKRHAFPVLADHGFKALLFVITGFVGKENTWDVQYGWRKFRHLDWDDLGKWQKKGIEVHSHGVSHARLTWLSNDAVAEELGRSREKIGSELGRAPIAISYPYGAVDERVRRLAREAGYTLGLAGPTSADPRDPMRLERRPVYAWDGFAPPWVMQGGVRGALTHGVAQVTNSFAVGTALIQKAFGKGYR